MHTGCRYAVKSHGTYLKYKYFLLFLLCFSVFLFIWVLCLFIQHGIFLNTAFFLIFVMKVQDYRTFLLE